MKKILLIMYSWVSYFAKIFYCDIGEGARIAINIGYSGIRQNIRIGKYFHMESHAVLKAEKSASGEIVIGDNCYLGMFSIIKCYGGKIKIGSNVSINPFCFINGAGGLTVGDNVRIAAHTSIIASNHKFDLIDVPIRLQGVTAKGVVIEDDVWIGTGARILDGVTIGRGAVIGAGAIVTKSLDAFGVYVGCPARKVKDRRKS